MSGHISKRAEPVVDPDDDLPDDEIEYTASPPPRGDAWLAQRVREKGVILARTAAAARLNMKRCAWALLASFVVFCFDIPIVSGAAFGATVIAGMGVVAYWNEMRVAQLQGAVDIADVEL